MVFDLDAMMSGGDVLVVEARARHPHRPASPGTAGDVRWIETDPFFVWHYGNAFDDGDDVVVDFSWWSKFALGPDPDRTGAFTQMRLSPANGQGVARPISTIDMSEFARIDDRLCGHPTAT